MNYKRSDIYGKNYYHSLLGLLSGIILGEKIYKKPYLFFIKQYEKFKLNKIEKETLKFLKKVGSATEDELKIFLYGKFNKFYYGEMPRLEFYLLMVGLTLNKVEEYTLKDGTKKYCINKKNVTYKENLV